MESPQSELKIGQYILEEELGSGGMAEVWKARNALLGNTVAIKFLNPRFAGHAEIEKRFLDEGKRQATLQHPNIVSAFDFMYVDGRSFLVMKYIKGETLEQRLLRLRAPMPLPAVLAISNDVLGALGHAHAEKVVHRDIKPSNILLENTGRSYVLDFGIALALGEQRVTRAGTAIGTPHYMSPEQIVGSRELDQRSDIYSYGCVLYQMLAEIPPFDFKEGEGDTEFFVKHQHLYDAPPPLSQIKPDIPEAVERVVLRCLQKKPEDRFLTCQELLSALQDAISARPAAFPPRRATLYETPKTRIESGPPPATVIVESPTRTARTSTPGATIPDVSAGLPRRPKKRPMLAFAVVGVALALALGGIGYYLHTSGSGTTDIGKVGDTANPAPAGPPTATASSTSDSMHKNSATKAKESKPKHNKATESEIASDNTLPPSGGNDTGATASGPTAGPNYGTGKASGTAPPPVSTNPSTALAQWQTLRCPGPTDSYTFHNLPNRTLHLDFDRTTWRVLLKNLGDSKDLRVVGLRPGVLQTCEIRWYSDQ